MAEDIKKKLTSQKQLMTLTIPPNVEIETDRNFVDATNDPRLIDREDNTQTLRNENGTTEDVDYPGSSTARNDELSDALKRQGGT